MGIRSKLQDAQQFVPWLVQEKQIDRGSVALDAGLTSCFVGRGHMKWRSDQVR